MAYSYVVFRCQFLGVQSLQALFYLVSNRPHLHTQWSPEYDTHITKFGIIIRSNNWRKFTKEKKRTVGKNRRRYALSIISYLSLSWPRLVAISNSSARHVSTELVQRMVTSLTSIALVSFPSQWEGLGTSMLGSRMALPECRKFWHNGTYHVSHS